MDQGLENRKLDSRTFLSMLSWFSKEKTAHKAKHKWVYKNGRNRKRSLQCIIYISGVKKKKSLQLPPRDLSLNLFRELVPVSSMHLLL